MVTAYGDEYNGVQEAASDLAKYRSNFGLPPCTVADGCFKQVNQTGSTTDLPGASAGWSPALSISMDMISAICPNCHILVVEANSSAVSDLGIAENEAVALGADFVDNDWGIPEADLGSSETSYDSAFDHPGVAITAPVGNGGYGDIDYPAASQYVTAVGGTTLTADSGTTRGYTEIASEYSASGCSAYEPKPSWQADTGCANRMLNDLAADSDPATPVAYYDTPTEGTWGTGSGTAVAAAIVAASYALAGTPAPGTYPASYPYTSPGGSYTSPGNAYAYPDGLNNITSGSDGTCAVSYWCTAGAGYNGPTGLGSPSTALSLTTAGETGQFQPHTAADTCLGFYTSGSNTVAAAVIQSCNGSDGQHWTAHSNGTITLSLGGNPMCLDVAGGGTASGTTAEISSCSGAASQEWSLTSADEVVNAHSGLCLTDPKTAENTQLEIETCASNPAADQQWTAPYDRPTASGAITSQITKPKICVDDTGDATTNGNKIQIWSCLGNANQDWAIEPDGTIQVNGKCMVTDNNGTSNGTKVNLWTCTGDTNQQWTERSDGTLVNTRSGTCLDDPGATTANGTQLQIWSCDGLTQQSWTLP